MARFRNKILAVAVSVALLGACVAGFYLTRDADPRRSLALDASKPAVATVATDYRLLKVGKELASQADSADEQDACRAVVRLADHEVDLAFASALRDAAAAPPPVSGPLKTLGDRIERLKAVIAAQQSQIDQWKKAPHPSDLAASKLELAQAQLSTRQDALDDLRQDFIRQGGDPHAWLEEAFKQHEAEHNDAVQFPKASSAEKPYTFATQAGLVLALNSKMALLDAARQQAAAKAVELSREHATLKDLLNKNPLAAQQAAAESPETADSSSADNAADGAPVEEDPAQLLARLRNLSDQQKTLTGLDLRLQDVQQIAQTYQQWIASVQSRRTAALHEALRTLAWILSVILAALLAILLLGHAIDRGGRREGADRRRLGQLHRVAALCVEVAAALVILLIVFGPPSQLSTIIGLATAGLTVAMKDFIVAFLGWFTLIGKNGIHPGDWVEIEGIGGEVIELSLMHTVLLELGDSAGAGHPTGRRVTFVNSYAIEKRWFNFTTTGQWLWDELLVTLPPETDPYRVAEQMRLVVERETNPDAEAANRDWARVTRDYAVSQFSATVRMDLRPSSNGLEVRIRYITSAQKRFEMKSKLLREIVAITYPVLDEAAQVAKPIECGAPKPAPRMDVPAPG